MENSKDLKRKHQDEEGTACLTCKEGANENNPEATLFNIQLWVQEYERISSLIEVKRKKISVLSEKIREITMMKLSTPIKDLQYIHVTGRRVT